MDIPTYDHFFEKQDMENLNKITGLSLQSLYLTANYIDNSFGIGDIDISKIGYGGIETVVLDNPNGFSQTISSNAQYTDITGAYINSKLTRSSMITLQINVGFVLTVAGGAGNVTIRILVDGIARPSKIYDFGSTAVSGVGLQSTRSIQDLFDLPFGKHTIKLQARYDQTAGAPNLNINSFHIVYMPLGN